MAAQAAQHHHFHGRRDPDRIRRRDSRAQRCDAVGALGTGTNPQGCLIVKHMAAAVDHESTNRYLIWLEDGFSAAPQRAFQIRRNQPEHERPALPASDRCDPRGGRSNLRARLNSELEHCDRSHTPGASKHGRPGLSRITVGPISGGHEVLAGRIIERDYRAVGQRSISKSVVCD